MTHICTSFWSILPVDIACAPSAETFKSRLIEAIRTGAIVVAPPRTVTTIHAGVGARRQPLEAFWDGRPWEGIKKKKIVHRLFFSCCYYITQFYTYFTSLYTYFYILLCINIIWFFTLQHFNNFSHTRLFIYVRLLLFNLLFLESIHSLLFRHIIIFLNHGQYTPRGPDH